ncbi:MAG TPA: ATP-binding protein [Ilumatobacteraceae bacterium]|jgi:anti-sigma regulatory factor (Ser/Thr protein kinase)
MSDPAAMLELRYRGEAATLGEARREVLHWLREAGADQPTLERAALIVSELATNALEASPGSVYQVHVTRADTDHVAISVRNKTKGTVPPTQDQWRTADPTALRGRGLAIVKSLSEDVTVDNHDGNVVVTARLRLR